jgi:hypothetical protein
VRKRPSHFAVLIGSDFWLFGRANLTKSFADLTGSENGPFARKLPRENARFLLSDGFCANMRKASVCVRTCGARVNMRGRAEYAGH